jgi:tetratricopeptide (TPR) repeat protein
MGTHAAVHYLSNQKLVQTLELPRKFTFMSTGDEALVTHGNTISLIAALPAEQQLKQLVDAGQLTEAVALALVLYKGVPDAPARIALFYSTAGLSMFAQGRYAEALRILTQSTLDPREFLGKFPALSPPSAEPYRPLHGYEFADSPEAQVALLSFLEKNRKLHLGNPLVLKWVDTALVKLYLDHSPVSLYDFLAQKPQFQVADVEPFLKDRQAYYWLGVIYQSLERYREALDIWKKYVENVR